MGRVWLKLHFAIFLKAVNQLVYHNCFDIVARWPQMLQTVKTLCLSGMYQDNWETMHTLKYLFPMLFSSAILNPSQPAMYDCLFAPRFLSISAIKINHKFYCGNPSKGCTADALNLVCHLVGAFRLGTTGFWEFNFTTCQGERFSLPQIVRKG